MEDEVGREVVLHYRDGSTLRGTLLREFSPGDHCVDVRTADSQDLRVEFEGLKAVFFIKDPRRRDLEVQISSMDMHTRASAASARVEFFDGEVVHGRVAQYSVEEHGFFLFPTAPESNNEKIFVVVQALKTLYVETLADGESLIHGPMTRSCRVAAVVAFVLAAFGVPAAKGEDRATDRLGALNRALSGAPAWHAEFDQEYIPVGMTMGEKAHGQVWLAWPDRALFHTGEPPFRLMGLRGRTVRLVDLPDQTCDEHQLSDREWERVPLAAVLDPRGALVHFDIIEGDDVGIILIPKEPGGVDRVEVILGEDNLPDEVSIRDPQGAVNLLRFSDWKKSKEPPEGAWLPEAPANVECSTDPGPLD